MNWYFWNDKTSPRILCHSSILLTIAYHSICFMMRYGAQNETYIEDERPKRNEVV